MDGPNDWLIYSPSSVTVSYETSVRIEDSQENFVKEDFYAEWVRICLPDGASPGPPTTKPPTTTTTTTTTTTDYTGPSTTVDPSDCSRTRGENPRNPRDSDPLSDLSYSSALAKSLLFYDAQMSGKLPKWHGVPWRGDSGLTDGCDVDYDLTGGFYDAGDFVKFHFPQSFALTVLGWGAIEFKDGYEKVGEYQHILNLLKWGIDHFKKCHARDHPLYPNIFWGQIGHGATDHAYLGRPEDMSMKRPAYEISSDKPGSELAAGAAAVMAVGAQLFAREGETDYANDCLIRARELLNFAVDYQKEYHLSITDATEYYKSWSGYNDEIVLAGGLIAKASKAGFKMFRREFKNHKMLVPL